MIARRSPRALFREDGLAGIDSRMWYLAASIIGLVMARFAIGLALWRSGWSALSEDDFHRVALAQEWASRPFLLNSPDMVWLPLQAWVHGLAFWLAGRPFVDDPMLLVALVNSGAALAAAAFAGRAAHHLFGSARGAVLAFAVVLFSPYAIFTSLSGLSEPLYYLAVALAVWGIVAWWVRGRTWALAVGSLGIAASAALRYEGWILAASWVVIIAFTVADADGSSLGALLRSWRRHKAELALAAAPMLIPVLRLAIYAAHHGTVLGFLALQAQGFTVGIGQGAFRGEIDRWLYYPVSLVRSAPVLMPALAILAVWCLRTTPATRPLVSLIGLQFVVFCVLSVSSGAMGGFRERFMFAFAVGLSPLVGAVPLLVDRLRPRSLRWAAACLLASIGAGAVVYGLANPPDEWSPPADLLEVSTSLGASARARGRPLTVVLGPGTERDGMILQVANGGRLRLAEAGKHGLRDPVSLPAWIDVWLERLPSRVAALPVGAGRVIGRYYLYGPAASQVPGPDVLLAGWSRRDESGALSLLVPTSPLVIEFADNDPRAGATVALERAVARGARARGGSLRIRTMYGHGFYLGRILAEVRVDGQTVFRRDVATRGGGETVRLVIPSGAGNSVVAVVLTALPGIEPGWDWGRVSTTLVTDFRVDGGTTPAPATSFRPPEAATLAFLP